MLCMRITCVWGKCCCSTFSIDLCDSSLLLLHQHAGRPASRPGELAQHLAQGSNSEHVPQESSQVARVLDHGYTNTGAELQKNSCGCMPPQLAICIPSLKTSQCNAMLSIQIGQYRFKHACHTDVCALCCARLAVNGSGSFDAGTHGPIARHQPEADSAPHVADMLAEQHLTRKYAPSIQTLNQSAAAGRTGYLPTQPCQPGQLQTMQHVSHAPPQAHSAGRVAEKYLGPASCAPFATHGNATATPPSHGGMAPRQFPWHA